MFWFTLFGLLFVAGVVAIAWCPYREAKWMLLALWTLIAPLPFYGLAALGCSLTTGCAPNYARGTCEGYIVSLSETGLIWKTYEGQIQLGAGRQPALQGTSSFSIPPDNPKVIEQARALTGKRVRVTYKEWFILPFSRGSTSYEATSIEALPDTSEK